MNTLIIKILESLECHAACPDCGKVSVESFVDEHCPFCQNSSEAYCDSIIIRKK